MSQALTISQIAIPVQDLERAIGFYRDILGLSLLFTSEPGMAFLDGGGVRLMLSAASTPLTAITPQASIIYYRVDDLAGLFARMQAAGASVLEAPQEVARLPDHSLWMAFFGDGEGNTLALMEERR